MNALEARFTHIADCGLRGKLTEGELDEIEIQQKRQIQTGDPDGFLHTVIMDVIQRANARHDQKLKNYEEFEITLKVKVNLNDYALEYNMPLESRADEKKVVKQVSEDLSGQAEEYACMIGYAGKEAQAEYASR